MAVSHDGCLFVSCLDIAKTYHSGKIHEGFKPALECNKICEAGWGYFLGSLKNYVETGNGSPYREAIAKKKC